MGETPGSVVTLLCSGMHFFNAEKRIADCVLEDTTGVAAMTSAVRLDTGMDSAPRAEAMRPATSSVVPVVEP